MPYNYRNIHKRLVKLGYIIVRQGKGSHVIYGRKSDRIIVPHHGGQDISSGVEMKIIKQVGLRKKEFKDL